MKTETFMTLSNVTEKTVGSPKMIVANPPGDGGQNKMVPCYHKPYVWLEEVRNDSVVICKGRKGFLGEVPSQVSPEGKEGFPVKRLEKSRPRR